MNCFGNLEQHLSFCLCCFIHIAVISDCVPFPFGVLAKGCGIRLNCFLSSTYHNDPKHLDKWKVCSNGLGHVTKMATTSIYGENL